MNKIVKFIAGASLAFLGAMSLASCGGPKDITGTLKLEHDFTNKDYRTDGIGVEKLVDCIDGDTIVTRSGNIRFLAVDTPESTAQVEKWGKAASKFTRTKLEEAEKIVLEAEGNVGQAATTDNNGRYLAFIWYLPKGANDYRNLNLELVQEGYSDYRDTDKYQSYFKEAAEQAKKLKLHVHAPKDVVDPDYSGVAKETNLKEITEALAKDPSSILGTKVKFEAYVSGVHQNKYVICQEVDGKIYSIDLYAGPGGNITEYNCIGNKLMYVGFVQIFKGEYQISGLIVSDTNPKGTYTEVTQYGYYLQFGDDILTAIGTAEPHLYGDFVVDKITVDNNIALIDGHAMRRGIRKKRTMTISISLKEGEKIDFQIGDRLTFAGTTKTSVRMNTNDFTVYVNNLSDIELV